MGWPLSQDYNEAVQAPRASFADPDLKAGEVATGPMGLPLPRSGNFADVYQVRTPDGRTWAVKCFTRPVVGLKDRYARIDLHLQEAGLPFTVGFRFLSEGIKVRGQWYPVVKMEWVEGFTLNEFVRQQLGRADMLRALLGMWVRLCKRLRDAEIAHADLQHGNVLLVPGETANKLKLRLIDYDGMWVPDLAGKPSGEAGHPAYQHPARLRDRIYSADVDRFPHLVIGCALRALAVAGKPLFDQFDNGDNLLFREADLAHPEKSRLFRTLWDLDDPTVTNLLALIVMSVKRPVRDTPWLDEVLDGEKAQPVSDAVLTRTAAVLGVATRAARRAAPTAQIYSVPEEANAFANLLDDTDGPRRPRRARRRQRLPILPLVAGGGVVAAAGAMLVLLLGRGGKEPDATPEDPGIPLAVGTDPGRGGPATGKRGILETQWAAVESGKPVVRTANLPDGLDPPMAPTFLRSFPVPGAGAHGTWLLPDGARAVAVGDQGFGILDLRTGKVTPVVADLDLVRAAVTPDGRYVLTADKDRIVRCFEVDGGKQHFARGFPSQETVLVITPDGKRVGMTAEGVGYAEWALPEGEEIRRHGSLQAAALAFSPDGRKAVAAGKDGIELWDLDEGTARLVAADVTAAAVGVSADGTRAIAGTSAPGRELRAWALADGRPLPARALSVRHPVTALAMAADGTVFVGTQGGEVGKVPEGAPSARLFTVTPAGPVVALDLTADGQHVLAANRRGSVYLSRTALPPEPPRPKESPPSPAPAWLGFIRTGAVSPDLRLFAGDTRGDRFLVAGRDRLAVYDTATLKVSDSFKLADGQIMAAGFGPDKLLVLCEKDAAGKYRTRAWNPGKVEAGTPFAIPAPNGGTLAGFSRQITPVPDRPWVLANTLAAGDTLFDPKTGKPPEGWPASGKPTDPIVAAASPDGKVIAFGSAEEPVQLWDCDTAGVRTKFEASAGFTRLAFTPDGRQLVGSAVWGRIRLWDARTGKLIREVDHDHPGPIHDLTPMGGDLAAVLMNTGWQVMDLASGRVAGSADDVPAPLGSALPLGHRGWFIARAADSLLAAWVVRPDLVATAPALPPAPDTRYPDVKVVRDAPRRIPVGLAITGDGQHLISAEAGRLTRYAADRLAFAAEAEADEGPLRGLAWAKDKLYTLGRKSVSVRDPETFEKVADHPATITAGSSPPVFAVHPDGELALIATDRVRELDLKAKRERVVPTPRAAAGKPLTQFAWSRDGRVGVARWANEVTTVWNPKTGEARSIEDLKAPAVAAPQGLAVSDDGLLAALGTRAGELRVWNTRTGKVLLSETDIYPATGPGRRSASVESVLFLPARVPHLVTVGSDGRTYLWKVADVATRVREFKGPGGLGPSALNPNGRTLVIQLPQSMHVLDLPDLRRVK